MRRSSRQHRNTDQQNQPPAPPRPPIIHSNGVARDVSERVAAERAARPGQPQPPMPTHPVAPASVPPDQRPVGQRNIQPHTPQQDVPVGARHIREHRRPGQFKEGTARTSRQSPIVREHRPNTGNFRDARPTTTVRQQQPTSGQLRTQGSGVPQQAQPPMNPALAQREPAPRPLVVSQESPVADVTVFIATAFRQELLRGQLDALVNASVRPAAIWIWVNSEGAQPIDSDAISSVGGQVFRTNGNLGGWPRLHNALNAVTRYVLLLDDDCIPGEDWLRLAVERLDQAEQAEEDIVIACEGSFFAADDPTSLTLTGHPDQEVLVDVGSRGWIAPLHVWQEVASLGRAPIGIAGMGLFLGAAASTLGVPTIMLPTPEDNSASWGAITEEARPSLSVMQGYPEAFAAAYGFYRANGWVPLAVQSEEAPESDGDQPADDQGQADAVQATIE